jgi:two-component system sensor histidine kinase UhpB
LSILEQQSLFEVVMGIGNGTDTHEMLQSSLSIMIRRLGCHLGAVVRADNETMEIVHSIPNHVKNSPEIILLCKSAFGESKNRVRPLIQTTPEHTLMVFTMPDYGILVLGKVGLPFSKRVMGTLVRIAEKLAIACVACEQTQIIQKEQQHFQMLESRYRFLFSNSPLPVWVIDAKSLRFLNVNDLAIQHYGYTREEFSQMTLHDIRPLEDIPEMLRLIASMTHGRVEGELRHLKKDGTLMSVEINSTSINYDGIPARISIVQDVTERKRINNELEQTTRQLRELVSNYEALQVAERKLIAREVHDELGQTLSTLRFNISMLNSKFGTDNPDLSTLLKNMKELIDHAIFGVRNVSENLHPAVLNLGVFLSIKWLCENFTSNFEIPCIFNSPEPSIKLAENRAIVLFRIVQESLNNIMKHAGAQTVQVSLSASNDQMSIEVRDDGKGFEIDAPKSQKTFGLFGMRERVRAVGGSLTITSERGTGTRVWASIPIQDVESQK